jgi:hypothetical protein
MRNTRNVVFGWAIVTVAVWTLGVVFLQTFGAQSDEVTDSLGFRIIVVGLVISIPSLIAFLAIWALDAFLRARRENGRVPKKGAY